MAGKMAESTDKSTELLLSKLAAAVLTNILVTSTIYSRLKPKQPDAMDAFSKGHDVFVSLPKGYGNRLFCHVTIYI